MTSPSPLRGLRVLEFTHMVMGPTAGMALADLGAEVVKVEPAPEGDSTRRLTGSGIGFYASFGRNRRSLCVDMKRAEGLALVQRLAARADVLIENFRPARWTSLASATRRCPRPIPASSTVPARASCPDPMRAAWRSTRWCR
jgi:crotonobetainyl-CoA:carnitine CoA-transferase CaiB-like acyl-CoA transferase